MKIDPVSGSRLSFENSGLFRGLSSGQKNALVGMAIPCRFQRGTTIFRQGAASVGFYTIHSGAVNVYRLSPDGTERVLRIFHAGESFAVASILPAGVYPAHARAEVDCLLSLTPRVPLLALLKSDPDFALRMTAVLSLRIHALAGSLESHRGESVRVRLLRWLLSRRPPAGNPVSFTIQLSTSKVVLAAELGMRQETLSRHLTDLRESGDLAIRGREIVVLNFPRLQELLNKMLS